MPMYESSKLLPTRCDERLFKNNTFVTRKNGLAKADQPIAIADGRWYMSYLVATRFALSGGASELAKRFQKERLDIVGLQSSRFSTLHILSDPGDAAGIRKNG